MAPLIPVAVAQKLLASGASASRNDIAVYRTSYVKGKGKRKRTIDREIHVNPVSVAAAGTVAVVGLGAAVGLGAIGLFAAGMAVSREGNTSVSYIAKRTTEPSADHIEIWTVYNRRGVPLRRITGPVTTDNAITDSQRARGWAVTSLDEITGSAGAGYIVNVVNVSKRHFALSQRSHNSLISVGGGGGGVLGGLL